MKSENMIPAPYEAEQYFRFAPPVHLRRERGRYLSHPKNALFVDKGTEFFVNRLSICSETNENPCTALQSSRPHHFPAPIARIADFGPLRSLAAFAIARRSVPARGTYPDLQVGVNQCGWFIAIRIFVNRLSI